MRKGFKKFLSGAVVTVLAVAGMTIGMTAVAMAAENVYKMNEESTGLTAYTYDGSSPSDTLSSATVLNPNSGGNITVLSDLNPALISYTGNSAGYFLSEAVDGPLAGEVLDYAIMTVSGSSKDFITISNLEAGNIVGVYYTGVDSKGATGKATTINISQSDDTKESYSVSAGDATKYPAYAEYTCTIDGTVTIATTGSRVGIAAIVVTVDDDGLYWPEAGEQTYAVSEWVGGTPVNYSSGNAVYNGAENNGGTTNISTRIRLGRDACTDTENPTIANCGYISFPGLDDGFTINISASSSGSSSRTFYVGLVNDDGTFTDKATLSVTGSEATTVSAKIYDTSSSETYAVYVKPYENNGELVPAENTNIHSIDVAPIDAAYLTTPAVTLSDVTVDDEGTLTVIGTFNDFSGSYYLVDSITLNAVTGKDSAEDASWTENSITVLRDNGDGIVSFVATGDAPEGAARLQAVATYVGDADITLEVGTVTIYSNVVSYSAE